MESHSRRVSSLAHDIRSWVVEHLEKYILTLKESALELEVDIEFVTLSELSAVVDAL